MGQSKSNKVKRKRKGRISKAGFVAFLLEVGWTMKEALEEWNTRKNGTTEEEEDAKADIEWELIPKEHKKRASIQ